MNKKIGLGLIALLFSSLLVSFVSAYGGYGGFGFIDLRMGSEQVINGVVDFAEPFLRVLLGGNDWSGYLLFEKFLLFVILVSLVYISVKNIQAFSDNKGVMWIISLGVPLMGIRFMDFLWINTVLIQYQILAIALTAGLPFIIYFMFLYKGLVGPGYASLRKIAWIFFAVIYYGLWSTGTSQGYPEVYLYTALLALLFFFFDGTLAKHFSRIRTDKAMSRVLMERLIRLEKDYKDIENSVIATSSPADKRRVLKEISDEIKEIQRQVYA